MVPLLSALIAIFIIGLVLAWYLSRPLLHLRWALQRVARGHLETRVRPLMRGRRDEIADLAHDFDGMAEQLQKAVESRRTLLHDVSHELRSPLSRLQVAIGLMRRDPSLTESMLERIESESERLNDLIEELLTLHRLEAGVPSAPPERVDLIELLQAIAYDADFEARAAGCHVSIDAKGSFVAQVHGELIYRAFENVIRNAVKYSPKGTFVDVHAIVDPSGLTVRVADRGPGVPPEKLSEMFEPFMRIGKNDGRHGAGLGLAITRRAMAMHGAQVNASLREGGGLVINLSFPSASQTGSLRILT
jgi:two-component system OmpR family sensor kinase